MREVPVPEFFEHRPLWGEPHMASEEHPLQDVFERMLAEFEPVERELLTMSLIGGLSVRQIAECIGMAKSVVYRKLQEMGLLWHEGDDGTYWMVSPDSELSALMKEFLRVHIGQDEGSGSAGSEEPPEQA